MDAAELDKLLAKYITDYSWTEPNLLKSPPTVIWVLKFPNNYGMIIRKDNGKNTSLCQGFIDTLGYKSDYDFERPKQHRLVDRKFESIQELVACIEMVKGYSNYEPKR